MTTAPTRSPTGAARAVLRMLRKVPLYPAALAAAFVITRLLQSVEPMQVLARPLIVVVLVVIVFQILCTLVTRNLAVGGFFAAAIVMLLADPMVGFAVLVAGTIPLISSRGRVRRLRPIDWMRLTTILNIVGLMVLALNVGPLIVRSLIATSPRDGASAPADASSPDIYLIMLDGYPRADTLLTEFQFDNRPFLDSMEGLGFEVADDAHTNYNATLLTLSSMLNMRPVAEVVPEPAPPPNDARQLIRSLNDASGLATLRQHGYTIVSVVSGINAFAVYSADQVLDTGQINNFEITIARAGLLPLLLPGLQNTWVHDQLRNRITDSLDWLVTLSGTQSERPRFVLAHLMSPHPPIVFGADGSPRDGWGCFPQGCDPWGDVYRADIREPVRGQVAHLNTLVHDAVAGILQRSTRDAVIIVFSDHGRRHDLGDRDEMIRSLFMSYTPGHPGLFPSDTSPVNILPRLLNAYEGLDLPLASEDSFVLDPLLVPSTGYFDLTPWPPR